MNSGRRRGADQTIFAEDVQQMMSRYQGGRSRPALHDLERVEPALAAYIKSTSEAVGMQLSAHDCTPLALRETQVFVEYAMLVAIESVRLGHRRLFEDFMPAEDLQKPDDTETRRKGP